MTIFQDAERLVEEINKFNVPSEELKEKHGSLLAADKAEKPLKNELRALIEIASDTMNDADYITLRGIVKKCYIKFLI